MNLTEKVAYLKGLMDGMEIDLETKEGKLFAAIADVLEDLALSVSDLDDDFAGLYFLPLCQRSRYDFTGKLRYDRRHMKGRNIRVQRQGDGMFRLGNGLRFR